MRRGQVTGIVLAAGLVLLLGLWHLTDVRAGVVASGDRWLYGYYIWLLLFGMVFLAMSGYQMCAGRQWSLERFFVWQRWGWGSCSALCFRPCQLRMRQAIISALTSCQTGFWGVKRAPRTVRSISVPRTA